MFLPLLFLLSSPFPISRHFIIYFSIFAYTTIGPNVLNYKPCALTFKTKKRFALYCGATRSQVHCLSESGQGNLAEEWASGKVRDRECVPKVL